MKGTNEYNRFGNDDEGCTLNVFELVKAMIDAGAAGVHLEDQLASEKKSGHMGGKVLIPTQHAIKHLAECRTGADICDVPTVLVARTDADAANLLTSDAISRSLSANEAWKDPIECGPALSRRLRVRFPMPLTPTCSVRNLRR